MKKKSHMMNPNAANPSETINALFTPGIKMRFGRSDHKWTTLNTGVNWV